MKLFHNVNPFTMSGLFYLNSLDWSISNSRVSGKFLLLLCFIEIPVVNANSVDPDQMQHSAISDLSLHCLPITFWGSPDQNGLQSYSLYSKGLRNCSFHRKF